MLFIEGVGLNGYALGLKGNGSIYTYSMACVNARFRLPAVVLRQTNNWEVLDMKKQFLPGLVLLTAIILIANGCHPSMTAEERKAFDDATAVMNYFPVSSDGSFGFSAGPYLGGTAIIGPNEMAFWVKDGNAYAVNQAAKDAAPELEPAPDTVKYDAAFIDAAHCE